MKRSAHETLLEAAAAARETPDAWLNDGDVRLFHGDCIEVMRALPAESIDAIITDPPYGISFMGKAWDGKDIHERARKDIERKPSASRAATGRKSSGWDASGQAGSYDISRKGNVVFQEWCEAWARECYRILKPGGHLASFCSTRTSHRMTAGIEDAGFEIRDTLAWLYGSGFPKSLDVSKAIDKSAGAERTVVGEGQAFGAGSMRNRSRVEQGYRPTELNPDGGTRAITAPATPEAQAWDGWGTALKPAHEPITLARKPLVGTVAANVLKHATGALNIDACRIAGIKPQVTQGVNSNPTSFNVAKERQTSGDPNEGRWPANVILDAEAAELLDTQSGHRAAGNIPAKRAGIGYGSSAQGTESGERIPLDSGGASRFFYTAKAAASERTEPGGVKNTHPTVKPVDLMRWLIRLLAPPGALILDPFGGSGTTGVAARAENVRCILIEREADYLPIIASRLRQGSLFAEGESP